MIRADVLDSDTRRRQDPRWQGRLKRDVYPGMPADGSQRCLSGASKGGVL